MASRYLPWLIRSLPLAMIFAEPPIISTYRGADSLGDKGIRLVGLPSK